MDELVSPSGGPWGGTKVDARFVELLGSALGNDFINKYQKKCPHEWLQFLTNFEKLKRGFKPEDMSSKICISLPWSMGNLYTEVNRGKKIEKALKSAEGLSFSNGMITIKHAAAKRLFEDVIQDIAEHLRKLLKDSKLSDVKYILMVGGFSECEVLQNAVKNEFERNGLKVLIPSEAQLAIIKGAVLYGHSPNEISSRVIPKTYGIATNEIFDATLHDENKRYAQKDGKDYCMDIFFTLVKKGTNTNPETVTKHILKKPKGYHTIGVRLFTVDNELADIKYVDEPDVCKIGEINLENLVTEEENDIEVKMQFGKTEMQVEAIDTKTSQRGTININFLL